MELSKPSLNHLCSVKECGDEYDFRSFWFIALTIVCFAGVFSGLSFFHHCRKLSRDNNVQTQCFSSRTNIFIVSLVVLDLLVGAVSVPIWTYLTFVNFQNIPIHLLEISFCFDIFSALASIFYFTAITIGRCYVISRTFTYGTLTNRVYKILISTAWHVAGIMAALPQMQTSITLKRAYTVFFSDGVF